MRLALVLVTAAQLIALPARADHDQDDDDRSTAPGADDDDADRAESIGIDELIGAAVRRSPSLMRIRAEKKGARELATAAAGGEQWRLGMSVDWRKDTAARVPGQPVQQVGESSLAAGLTARKHLPTGGDLELSFGDTKLYQRFAVAQQNAGTTTDATAEVVSHVAIARVGVVQPLVRGRGSTVARADRHRAELGARQAQIKARYDAGVMIRDLVSEYWEVAYDAAVIDVRRDSLAAAKEQLDAARDVYKAGLLPVSALKAAEYEISVREEALLRATMDLEDRSLETRQLAGLEVGPHDIALDPTDPLALDDSDWRVDDVLATAREHSPRIAGARIGVALADVDVAVADDARMPAVDFRASASSIGGGPTADAAVQGAGSAQAYELTAGVAVTYEIGGAAHAAGQYARALHTEATIDVAVIERDVTASVVRAVHRVRAARKRSEVAGKAIEVAQANLKAEQVAFRAGRQTSYIVLQRQTEVDEARLLRARAIADYHQAVAAVELESGELLTRWGVDLRDDDRR